MNSSYNSTYLKTDCLYDPKLKIKSFKHFVMEDGILLAMFQGNRGDNPELDFILKFLQPGAKSRLRTPKHMHWVVDLLLKMETYRKDVCEIINFYKNYYNKVKPFQTLEERKNYIPKTPNEIKRKYSKLNHKGTYSLEYVAHLIELFIICEKQSPRDYKMFEDLLNTLSEYCQDKKDFYTVMSKTVPGFKS